MLPTFLPETTGFRAVRIVHGSVAMILSILKLSLIDFSVVPFEFALSGHLIVLPLSIILFFFIPVVKAYTVDLV
jgi:hypothetical protein